MNEWISENVNYPQAVIDAGEQGMVYVKFVIGIDSVVTYVKVAKGASPLLNAEALRVISAMPIWEPGMINGEPVAVNYTIPINFVLDTDKHKKRKNGAVLKLRHKRHE